MREIALTWSDASHTLTWSVNGSYTGGAQSYKKIKATAFMANEVKTSAAQAIGTHGSMKL